MRGSVHGADGRPLRAQVEFVAGPNTGRLLDCDERGRFGANDLYAGLAGRDLLRLSADDGTVLGPSLIGVGAAP